MQDRVCNYSEIFIRHNGDVYPCCRLWTNEQFKIGHVTDADIVQKILSFYKPCHCEMFNFVKAGKNDIPLFRRFNIETSLTCQAKCAMCCAGSPDYDGSSDSPYIEHWEKLIDALLPASMTFQGGEVLVQSRTMEWLKKIRTEFPDISLDCVSNMSVDISRIDDIEYIFDKADVSMVGFQPETYKVIMGLDFFRTEKMLKELLARGKVGLMLKFLITPLNVHEISAWLNWAIGIKATFLQIAYAASGEWVRNESYRFWEKIFRRSSEELKKTLIRNFSAADPKLRLLFENNAANLLGITEDFVRGNSLSGIQGISGILIKASDCNYFLKDGLSDASQAKASREILPAFSDYYALLSEKYSSVYIYGAGMIGICLLDFIKDKNLPGPVAIIDDYCKEEAVCGIQVKKAGQLLFKKEDVVLLATDTYSREFTDNLNKLSCPASIKNISNFIKEI